MTSDSSSSAAAAKQPRKRIRDNHNELERIRRNNQKAQLDALRRALPFADMDDRASMVSIFIRSREYIEMLEKRVLELQALLGMPKDTALEAKMAANAAANNLEIPQPIRERLPSISLQSEQFMMHEGVQFFNPNLSPSATPPTLGSKRPASPLTAATASSQQNDQVDSTLNADLLMSFLTESYPDLLRVKRLSSDDDIFLKNFRQRRESSLLLPIQSSDAVVVQKRDSLSSLFSGLLPDVVEESALVGDVKCAHCVKGVDSMIMVDCDRCHKWYHLVCAGVDASAIPTFWTCKTCLK